MNALQLPSEVFDIALHPTRPLIVTALLSGHVSCYPYQHDGESSKSWHTKRHKGSCRGVDFSPNGQLLVSVGKDRVIKVADSLNGRVYSKDMEAHTEPINCVKYVSDNIFVTGDDIGVVKAWDSRTMESVQTYPDVHTDHITSFLPLPNINPHHVLCTSGDCTLSVLDLRKTAAVATSEDQEDEPLCSAFAGDSNRLCIGTQSGFVTLWKSGEWMDHVDRIAPAERIRKGDEAPSVDCMVQVGDGVIVGASDGSIRKLGFRPNQYGDVIGKCEEGVTCLASIPDGEDWFLEPFGEGWVVSASGSKLEFWNTNESQEDANEEEEKDSSEDEKPRKKKKKSKKGPKSSGASSAFFADL